VPDLGGKCCMVTGASAGLGRATALALDDTKGAGARTGESLKALTTQLKSQYARGVPYFVGDSVSALDIYWTAFANLLDPLPKEQGPMPGAWRPGFVVIDPVVRSAAAAGTPLENFSRALPRSDGAVAIGPVFLQLRRPLVTCRSRTSASATDHPWVYGRTGPMLALCVGKNSWQILGKCGRKSGKSGQREATATVRKYAKLFELPCVLMLVFALLSRATIVRGRFPAGALKSSKSIENPAFFGRGASRVSSVWLRFGKPCRAIPKLNRSSNRMRPRSRVEQNSASNGTVDRPR
jgi:hypothetical protein